MKKFIDTIFIISILMFVACSGSSDSQKQMPLSNVSVASVENTVSVDSSAECNVDSNSIKNQNPKVLNEYNLVFWDSLKVLPQAQEHYEQFKNTEPCDQSVPDNFKEAVDKGRNYALSFIHHKQKHTSEQIQKEYYSCINEAEKLPGKVATPYIISGYYIEMLLNAAQNFDEATLKRGIDNIDNLKRYINSSLQNTDNLDNAVKLRQIINIVDSCKIIYTSCNSDFTSKKPKYSPLIEYLKTNCE